MAQQVRVLGAKPDNLVQPLEPIWWKERTGAHRLFSDLHAYSMCHSVCVPTLPVHKISVTLLSGAFCYPGVFPKGLNSNVFFSPASLKSTRNWPLDDPSTGILETQL